MSPLKSDTDGDGVDDALDDFPLDPNMDTLPTAGGDTQAPVLTLTTPESATEV